MSLAVFISLLMCSTCFGHYYIHHEELPTVLLTYHIGRIVSWVDVCWGFGVDGLEWYPCCRLKHNSTHYTIHTRNRTGQNIQPQYR